MSIDVATLSAGLSVFSAIAIALLGVLVLVGGRERPRGALALGLFAILWGVHTLLGNVGSILSEPSQATYPLLLSVASLFLLPYLLVEFVHEQRMYDEPNRLWAVFRGATALLGIGGAMALLVRPDLVLAGVVEDQYGLVALWGPIRTVFQVALFAVLTLAAAGLVRAVERAPTSRTKLRVSVLLCGLLVYLGFVIPNRFAFYTAWIIDAALDSTYAAPGSAHMYAAYFGLLFLCLCWFFRRIWLLRRSAPSEIERRHAGLLLFAIALPAMWGAAEGLANLLYPPAFRFYTAGLWRLAGVGVLAYGMARWRLFDLPRRARRFAASSAGAGGAAAGGAVAYTATGLLSSGIVLPLLVGAGAFTGLVRPAVRLAQRWIGDEASRPLEDEAYGERLDAYRAALEASMARGTLDDDEAFLAALRERFGISQDVDRAFRHLARQAVLLPRDPGDTDAYERLRLLGEGGAGRTWLARDRTRDRLVVLKEPLTRWQEEQALQERVLREARAAARVDHPNVVRVHEVVRHRGQPVIVMEYVDGGSLEGLLRSQGVLPWQHAARILRDALEGLEAVHACGLVHRDVKPANILLTGEGQAKLADFGIATGGPSKDTLVAPEEGRPGTRTYQAPEVAAGQQVEDPRTDIYSAAAVLHECLYGSPPDHPVTAENPVPQPVQTVLHRGLAADPGKRFQSAGAFARALDEVIPS